MDSHRHRVHRHGHAVRADGGDPSKVDLQSVGFGLTPALASGRVDAIIGAYWNIEVPEIESRGVEVDVFRLEESGVPDYNARCAEVAAAGYEGFVVR